MKKSVIFFVVICAVVAGALLYLKQQKPAQPPAPVTETTPPQAEPQPQPTEVTPALKPAPAPVIAPVAPTPTPVAATAAATPEPVVNDATNSIHKIVDGLLAARSGKHDLFQQLNKEQLEGVIADLQQRALANPKDAALPTTLGEAQLNLVRVLHESGGDEDQVGILAMQADQSFKAALKIDPKNWEAQYVKASTTFYWPPNEARDNEAAQMLANLIDQQETMPTQQAFALTYLALGNQYQKMGKTAEAFATWQLGAQKFPSDPQLRQKLAGP